MKNVVVEIMKAWIGKNEADGSFKEIIDIYNSIKPLPVGYKLKYTDPWCAGTISAAFHKAKFDALIPLECSCARMIEKAIKMGIWVENDAFIPDIGDCLLYDWNDSGVGDNKGRPDHIGIVEKVSGDYITIIEGNYKNQVKRRKLKINSKTIRGYITPAYKEEIKPLKTNEEIAKEVISGKWGNGSERKKRLEEAGYVFSEIQKKVNEILKGNKPSSKPKELKNGDEIKLKPGAKYYNGKNIPAWVTRRTIYYRGKNSKGIIFSINPTGSITGIVSASNIIY